VFAANSSVGNIPPQLLGRAVPERKAGSDRPIPAVRSRILLSRRLATAAKQPAASWRGLLLLQWTPAGSASRRRGARAAARCCRPAAAPGSCTASAWHAGSCSRRAAGEIAGWCCCGDRCRTHARTCCWTGGAAGMPIQARPGCWLPTPRPCVQQLREETHCRFCGVQYSDDWRDALTPPGLSLTAPAAEGEPGGEAPLSPVMAVYYNGGAAAWHTVWGASKPVQPEIRCCWADDSLSVPAPPRPPARLQARCTSCACSRARGRWSASGARGTSCWACRPTAPSRSHSRSRHLGAISQGKNRAVAAMAQQTSHEAMRAGCERRARTGRHMEMLAPSAPRCRPPLFDGCTDANGPMEITGPVEQAALAAAAATHTHTSATSRAAQRQALPCPPLRPPLHRC
jgi:hypothetical protein